MIKKMLTCEECKYCDTMQKDGEFHAPCLVNPPMMRYDEKSEKWMSARPYTLLQSPACSLGKRKK